jgi:ATP-dependent DNA helicase HFM1/MER3
MSTEIISAGVAFHHAGLDLADRRAVEEGFLHGNINIICSTSTLAIGINMPCHLVIIKGTISWSENGVHQYADLEMMQMLGRAGRPQFESSACAVILTRDDKIKHYQNMVSGKELLESSLHLNLIDHLNAEIGLGTISNIRSAKQWLAGTFLFVRLTKNPNRYKLRGKANAKCSNDNELLEQICNKDLRLLQDVNLISGEGKLKCTEFGDAMARYCVKFETMKIVLSLPPKAKMSEIVNSSFFIICPQN